VGPGGSETGMNPDGSPRPIAGLNPALEFRAAPGEKIEGFSPNVPNSEFFDHVRLILTTIGINLGLPLILLTMDGSETNFSGWRGAMDQAKLSFRERQNMLISQFHKPVYEWRVRHFLENDKAAAAIAGLSTVNIFRHKWKIPSWPYIEPLKDASAYALRDATAQTSLSRLAAENGNDWGELYPEIANNRADAILYALQKRQGILDQFPDADVHWRDLMPLQMPNSVTGTMEIVKQGLKSDAGIES